MPKVGFASALFSGFRLTDRCRCITGCFSDVPLDQATAEVTTRNGDEHLEYGPGAVCVDDVFDLALAIEPLGGGKPVVCKNFRSSGHECIFVVTTPPQAGKTSFASMTGQFGYLTSLDCQVPASRARRIFEIRTCQLLDGLIDVRNTASFAASVRCLNGQ